MLRVNSIPHRMIHGPRRRTTRGFRLATDAARGARDGARLRARIPALFDRAAYDARVAELAPDHAAYCAEVSEEGMAASLRLCATLLRLCEATGPRTILDLGSGFTSYVFRRYAARAPHEVTVWSVDDSATWLDRTEAYLRAKGVRSDGLVLWDVVHASPPAADLVLHDLGTMDLRLAVAPAVARMVAPGGLLVLDDVHFRPYGPATRELARSERMPLYSLRALTLDRFHRHAALAVRGE